MHALQRDLSDSLRTEIGQVNLLGVFEEGHHLPLSGGCREAAHLRLGLVRSFSSRWPWRVG